MNESKERLELGDTQSLCPDCLALVPAQIVTHGQRVYFRKQCPTHGVREDFICSDVRWFDRMEYSVPGQTPKLFGVEPSKGCPYDCGLCTAHEQHTCIGLLEITSSCNLTCPMCFAASAPGGKHLTVDQCRRAIDRLVEVEGEPEILQLSGGEPTIHPEFLDILDYACAQPIDVVMINTNGIRFARDAEFLARVASQRQRVEIYFQWDGFDDGVNQSLRGVPLLAIKQRALDALAAADIRVTLVTTLQPGVNDHQIGRIVEFAMERPRITGINFQPATYTGRYVLPEQLDQRITFPDVIRATAEQTGGLFRESDFMPLPCAHPNAHSVAYAYRGGGARLPLARFIELGDHLDLMAGRITFTRPRVRALIEELRSRDCCGGNCAPEARVGDEFFGRALAEELTTADVLRITITSFMDAYNFDVRQLRKSCVSQLLPSGHLIPFSAYNVLYRDGHVPLPPLGDVVPLSVSAGHL